MTQNEFDNLIFKIRCESVSKFEEGDYDEGWKLCMEAWDMLPEPKYKQPESWFVVTNIIKYSIETKNFEYADRFLGLLFICALERADSEDREFWAGRLAYAKGDMDIAKELFARSLEKGNGYGYINDSKNRIYKELVQGKRKTSKSKSRLPADKLIDKADDLWDEGKNEEAEELYLQGLDKIDDLEGDDVDRYYRNAYAGLGDCCFKKKEYEDAKNYFLDAYNYDPANPYISMRIGECYVFLDNEEKARQYLLEAYMVDGEEVFIGNEPFLDIIKDLI